MGCNGGRLHPRPAPYLHDCQPGGLSCCRRALMKASSLRASAAVVDARGPFILTLTLQTVVRIPFANVIVRDRKLYPESSTTREPI
eukprot:6277072-Amphidinium_carterae.2